MEKDNSVSVVWKVLFLVSSVVASAWAVDSRYVNNTVFTEFKEGTVVAIFKRLDTIEQKADRMDEKLDKLLEKR